ncbi:hypothetical protein MLD38_005347 [Melastoma candidum]|uniref:Uncharacterized protein n=1 Tax=Melastoma candidum TaxID=119954 RepID=A0ACB9S8K3_9MYRT|nr:hypothetical protein MLD38_005347 [Melastoma candidum]
MAEPEPLEEWQHLSPSLPSSPKWLHSLLVRDDYLGEQSAFHPSRHEDLDPLFRPQPPPLSSSSSTDDEQPQEEEEEEVVVQLDDEAKEDGFGAVVPRSCSLLRAVYRVVGNGLFLNRGAWGRTPAMAAAGIVAVVFTSWAYSKFRKSTLLRWKRRRAAEDNAAVENLILLVKQKEERITQLMIQIARMHEVMMAQRRVRVLRVA